MHALVARQPAQRRGPEAAAVARVAPTAGVRQLLAAREQNLRWTCKRGQVVATQSRWAVKQFVTLHQTLCQAAAHRCALAHCKGATEHVEKQGWFRVLLTCSRGLGSCFDALLVI